MSLFKFTSADIGKKILSNLSIRFTQPAAFNDPFDCFPSIDISFKEGLSKSFGIFIASNPQLINHLKNKTLDSIYSELPSFLRLLPKDTLWQLAQNYMLKKNKINNFSEFISKHIDFDEIKPLAIEQFYKYFRSIFGVLSLSAKWNHHLMWSHYADSQFGIALELNENDEFFSQQSEFKFSKINHVRYTKTRPKFEFQIDNVDSYKTNNEVGNIFLRKSIDWVYEQEYRVIHLLHNKYNSGVKDKNGFEIYLYPLPNSVFKSVIFGFRTSQNKIDEIISLASQSIPHIKFYKVLPSSKNYNFKKKKISKKLIT